MSNRLFSLMLAASLAAQAGCGRKPARGERASAPEAGKAEVIIAKQRNGPVGTVRLAFLKEITRFEDLAGDDFDYVEQAEEA